MKNLFILSTVILFLCSCGGTRAPQTLMQWKKDHPYAKLTIAAPVDGNKTAFQYEDTVPSLSFIDTHAPAQSRSTKYIYSLLVSDDGEIVSSDVLRAGSH